MSFKQRTAMRVHHWGGVYFVLRVSLLSLFFCSFFLLCAKILNFLSWWNWLPLNLWWTGMVGLRECLQGLVHVLLVLALPLVLWYPFMKLSSILCSDIATSKIEVIDYAHLLTSFLLYWQRIFQRSFFKGKNEEILFSFHKLYSWVSGRELMRYM